MKSLLNRLGPGLLYAGAAVGVSHLVQSTRAGSSYGLIMIAVVILANVIKYPFFKAGPLFAAVSGKSLIDAFYEQGKWAMLLFYVVTVSTMFTVQAAVTLITASVLSSIFGLSFPLWVVSSAILLLCGTILLIGRYHLLDRLMKIVIILLTITTLVTLLAALFTSSAEFTIESSFSFSNTTDLFFLIALIGWMPAPLDISLWHSEWTLADKNDKGEIKPRKASNFDFKVGYWGTTLLAAVFVALGAIIIGADGKSLSSSGAVFAGQLIGMYTDTIGKWAFPIVALAAFTCMFSTTLTVLDAYPRVLRKALELQLPTKMVKVNLYNWTLLLTIIGALFVLIFQLENMKQLVDLATTVSFLTAPILATLIFMVVKKIKKEVWSKLDVWVAYLGLAFLYCFSAYYLIVKYF